ncbi:MAG: hypothetical protein PHI60_00530 [Candidatus Omnitrophica bacterium]|nr:hypothetical protein [Candidatus Omnitrophota bacterium]
MFNKKKVGLMARLDIPSSEDNINGSLKLAREFIEDISGRIPQEESAYIFGK